MPVETESYYNFAAPFWYEDQVTDPDAQCLTCGRRAAVLWVYRPQGENSRVFLRSICRGCEYTRNGIIAVQMQMRDDQQ